MAEINQTDAMVACLTFDEASSSFKLTAASKDLREKYICQFSGRSIVLFSCYEIMKSSAQTHKNNNRLACTVRLYTHITSSNPLIQR